MFDFFKKKYDNPMLAEEMRETQERWFVFLQKLEERMEEVCEAAIPQLKEIFEEDTDPYKRAHGRMLAGLLGQVRQMRSKANEVREQKIIDFTHAAEASFPSITSPGGSSYYNMLYKFKEACYERHRVFEENVMRYEDLLQKAAGEPDLETPYRKLLEEFEKTKDRFVCSQCSGNITIPKLFVIATYVTCPHCQTQNTFHPSTEAQMVLHNARSLAEQRTAALLKEYESGDPKDPVLYRQYLRAMFNEWNSIVPDMAEENEKFHERLLKDQENYHH
ncbi:hypothetical protein SAMN05518672_1089 [Chitinophaga sp. CF118]|uniref:hypothetical protein n=1 Tax=Chitinophaga sp. CF118 TaxID=1884367 RepID=UPI0008F3B617|nr:hypothetical protein [Chitinophaga sp. CF118]SFE58377.1 hypothetical protein SAMN05518672_1089 [Chitinophaga sp. CF118]